MQVTRLGFLDYIYSDVIINAGDEIDMGEIRLAAGDANRDGVISQEDVNTIKNIWIWILRIQNLRNSIILVKLEQ